MTLKMHNIATNRGAKFFALVEDVIIAPGEPCSKGEPFAIDLISQLKSKGITTLRQSEAYSQSLCDPNLPLVISIHDLHPNNRANMLSAQFLSNYVHRLNQ